ncbi:MAG: hypothetical protein J6P67_06000 [Bacteroidaceae bacterium]|nr:hypothetical protein [Bacteroidaceae bacterium]
MKVLLSGYGQMGKEIEKILLSRGHIVSAVVDPMVETAHKEISAAVLADADVVIDFSSPAAVLKNCTAYAQGSTPVVLGTTGWGDKYDQIKAMIEKAGIGFVWGSNFSIGAHMLFKLASYAAFWQTLFQTTTSWYTSCIISLRRIPHPAQQSHWQRRFLPTATGRPRS